MSSTPCIQGKFTVIVHRLVDREMAFQAALEYQTGGDAAITSDAATCATVAAPAAAAAAAFSDPAAAGDPAAACGSSSGECASTGAEGAVAGAAAEMHLPQLLVTRSEKLANKLEKEVSASFSCTTSLQPRRNGYAPSRGGSGVAGNAAAASLGDEDGEGRHLVDSSAILSARAREQLPASFSQLRPSHFPLVLTVRALLDMLNGSLREPFAPGVQTVKSGRSGGPSERRLRQQRLRGADDGSSTSEEGIGDDGEDDSDSGSEEELHSGDDDGCESSDGDESSGDVNSTKDYGQLPGADLSTPAAELGPNSSSGGGNGSKGTQQAAAFAGGCVPGAEVDFEVFVGHCWPRFDMQLRRDLEPSLVFAGGCGEHGAAADLQGRCIWRSLLHMVAPTPGFHDRGR